MRTLILTLIVAVSLAAFAQTEKTVQNAPANYIKALKSDNDGMVESALFHAMKYKLYYPDQNTSDLERQIERLVDNGDSETIRYKAFLANEFIQNDVLMNKIEKADYKDAGEFFKMLGKELNEHLFAAK
jgi:hypothetical protein